MAIDARPPDLAELYDLDCGDFAEDIPFYQSLARAAGGSVLELGVGTARVALPLANAGIEVRGVDTFDPMLARARCKAAEAGVSLELRNARMQDFELDHRFSLIYAPFGTLHHLLEDQDIADCLRSVRKHLVAEGIFACDLRPLFFEDWEEGDSVPLFHDWTRTLPRTGERVMKSRAVRNDASARLKSEFIMFDILGVDGAVRRVEQEQRLRYFGREEFESILTSAGLAVEEVYGGYHGEPFDEVGDHLIVVARTLEGAA